MVTITDIAKKMGVSISTVSKAMNGASDISESLRSRILDTAIEMGYVSKKMKKETFKKLCIFIDHMNYESPSEFGYDLVLGFKQAAFRQNWSVDLVPISEELEEKEKYDSFMLRNGYSGSFLLGLNLQDPWMKYLETTSIPSVLFDNFIPKNPHVGYVGIDNYEGIDLAVEYLYRLGHQNIAFVNGSPYSRVSDQRQQAFLASMKKYGLTPREEFIAHRHYQLSDCGDSPVENFIKSGVTAILCGSDLIALSVMEECKELYLAIPDDVSIVGFDDLPVSAYSEPSLTTIRQNRIELGKCAFLTLDSIIHHVPISRTLMRAQFIARASTCPCRKTTSL